MRASRTAVALSLCVVVGRASVVAQTNPPPGEQPPPPAPQPPPIHQPPPPQPPPPEYQQPPPGYQQPPPPDNQQPPPGYQSPPPGYYQQQPPPGYPPPPPGYYQQPPPGYYPPGYGYAPQPPPPQPPRPPPRTYGFLAMPYLGVSWHVGDIGSNLNAGSTIGVLLGGRLSPTLSMNGELRADALNFRQVPANESWEGAEFDLAFSPLFHIQFPAGELVLGPKLGLSGGQERDKLNGMDNGTYDWSGLTAGADAGVFFAVNRVMSLGGMFSFTVRDRNRDCYTPPGGTQAFTMGDYPSQKVLALHAGALF